VSETLTEYIVWLGVLGAGLRMLDNMVGAVKGE
jgi:hypothetical protein